MANDETGDRDAFRGPLDRESVKAVAADPALAVARRQQIGLGDVRERPVEGGVEDRDVRGVG